MSDVAEALLPTVSGEDRDGSYLKGARCENCGLVTLGLRSYCPRCWTENSMKAVAVGRRGVLYTRTIVHSPAPGFEGPYAVGYVDVTEGIRIFAHLQTGEGAPGIGDPVVLTSATLRKDADGKPLKGPRYRKAQGQEVAS